MTDQLGSYLRALHEYAQQVSVPWPDPEVCRELSLDRTFIEPRLCRRRSEQPSWEVEKEVHANAPGLNAPAPRIASSALHILETHRRVVILGEPGQGKSTLLRQHAGNLARLGVSNRVPLLIELGINRGRIGNPMAERQWLRERLPDKLQSNLSSDAWISMCEVLDRGRGVVFLDGFDELTVEARKQLQQLVLNTLADNCVILSSRPQEINPGRTAS
jgi:predicted NACHT family NTPase